MEKGSHKLISLLTLIFYLFIIGQAFGWHDKTHLAISQAAGYENWYNSAAADVTKTKAGDKEAMNHWFNNNADINVTEKMVFDQVQRSNNQGDEEGHLYGAIIASLRDYLKGKGTGKYGEYHMAFCAHYIGDLSMPLHNVPFGDKVPIGAFNKEHHATNDGIVEGSVLNNIGLIQKNMYAIKIQNENDLAREIARIANLSRRLAFKMQEGNRDLTKDEAYAQLYHSASLLQAVIAYAKGAK